MSLAMCLKPTQRGLPPRALSHGPPGSAALLFERDSVLESTPVEIILEVFKYLDLQTAFRLARVNRAFSAIFREFRVSILLPILESEFAPFSGLLQVIKASPWDLDDSWSVCVDKGVRRNNTVLCERGRLVNARGPYAPDVVGREVSLLDYEMTKILEVCKVVKGWERIFPQHRFHDSPLCARILTQAENERLRRALYHWMRYAYYFHGNLERPDSHVPVHARFLRALSNSELRELKDLWLTVRDIVEHKLCPSIDKVNVLADFELSERHAAQLGWGFPRENRIIVATICKLSPAEILYYVDNIHDYPKAKLLRSIREKHFRFDVDTESLTPALRCVEFERRNMVRQTSSLRRSESPFGLPMFSRVIGEGGGVLDWTNADVDKECTELGEMTGLGLDRHGDDGQSLIIRWTEMSTGLLEPSNIYWRS